MLCWLTYFGTLRFLTSETGWMERSWRSWRMTPERFRRRCRRRRSMTKGTRTLGWPIRLVAPTAPLPDSKLAPPSPGTLSLRCLLLNFAWGFGKSIPSSTGPFWFQLGTPGFGGTCHASSQSDTRARSSISRCCWSAIRSWKSAPQLFLVCFALRPAEMNDWQKVTVKSSKDSLALAWISLIASSSTKSCNVDIFSACAYSETFYCVSDLLPS